MLSEVGALLVGVDTLADVVVASEVPEERNVDDVPDGGRNELVVVNEEDELITVGETDESPVVDGIKELMEKEVVVVEPIDEEVVA